MKLAAGCLCGGKLQNHRAIWVRCARGAAPVVLALLFAGAVHAGPPPGASVFSEELAAQISTAADRFGLDYVPRTRHLDDRGAAQFTNRLVLEESPYLLQHAHNPVNWYPWGDEAFETARRLGRPVLLSVGYSTCHWCHVMEEESFEDLEIARYLNQNYNAIKVDRQERPDVDDVYMSSVQLIAGSGGWPMTVWLTPDRRPFYGGTYFPPRDSPRSRRPGFLTLLKQLRTLHDEEPERISAAGLDLTRRIQASSVHRAGLEMPGTPELDRALAAYSRSFDAENGGLRQRMKFPSSLPLPFLLRAHLRSGDAAPLRMARVTLDAMRRGGIYDHVGGGFHRYTTEPTWTVPHFEKMLYDNAQLVTAFVEAYQLTGDPVYAEVARDVLAYVSREMTSPLGTFYSATDADSEGEEGTFFVWNPAQVKQAVGPELAPLALAAYGVKAQGNFEHHTTVLRRDRSVAELAAEFERPPARVEAELEQIRIRLRETRARRVPPLRDDKQLLGWNALMIQAYLRAGFALRESDWIERGARAARVLLERASSEAGLARYLKDGRAHGVGVLDDYAFLIAALLDLFEVRGDPFWLDRALGLQAELDRRFFDDEDGGYYMTPSDGERLLVRQKPGNDGAVPSGNSVAVLNLLRLHSLTSQEEYRERAEMTLRAFSKVLATRPTALGRKLDALDYLTATPKEILIVTPETRSQADPFLAELARVFLPNRIVVVTTEPELPELRDRVPLLEHKRALDGKPTAYVCEDRVCESPARSAAEFSKQIRAPRGKRPAK
ncbi:MAG: thioredoxin domain-containing protein [Myxococcota bacterium]|nr:thioredoxin domain-containing protein [Myxococcota bacterium]